LEELAGLRDSLRAEEQARFEVSEERERLTKQLGDLDAALQVLNLHLPKLSGSKCVFTS
jgi:hypothetical protein